LAESAKVVVFAAGSLVDAFRAIGQEFESRSPGIEVSFRFASADHLRQDIVAGAQVDVFAPANRLEMDLVGAANLIVGTPRVFAETSLVLIASRENPRQIAGIGDLARSDLRVVAEHAEAPLSRYSAAMLASASEDPSFGRDFVARVEARVVVRTKTVRQMVARVLAGDADAGVVYASDVTPDVKDRLVAIEIPERFNVTASYLIAVIATGANPRGGANFVEYVTSAAGQSTLAQWGFRPVLHAPTAGAAGQSELAAFRSNQSN
jgi:molybdate transport system substrate-binding protein